MSWKIAVAVAPPVSASPSELVVFRPIGNRRSRTVMEPSARDVRVPSCAARSSARASSGADAVIQGEPEQLRRGRVGIDETAGGIDRDDSAAYVLEDISGLQAYLYELRRELLGSSASLAQPSRDVS